MLSGGTPFHPGLPDHYQDQRICFFGKVTDDVLAVVRDIVAAIAGITPEKPSAPGLRGLETWNHVVGLLPLS